MTDEGFSPDKITSINPDGAMASPHPSGASYVLTFFLLGCKEVVNVNLTTEAAVMLREQLPASGGIVTPPKPALILPG